MPSYIDHSDSRFNYLPQPVIELQKELSRHPKCRAMLQDVNDLAQWYATIGVYCDVAIDGLFDAQGIEGLTNVLHRKLVEKRTSIVLTQ